MNKKIILTAVLSFASGCAVTYTVTKKVLNKKFCEKCSLCEVYKTAQDNRELHIVDKGEASDYYQNMVAGYATASKELLSYANEKIDSLFDEDDNTKTDYTADSIPKGDIEYVSDREFGNDPDYSIINLTYYSSNDVLTDDFDNPIDDITLSVGTDFKEHFGEYSEYECFVKNNRTGAYYDITLVNEGYVGD